MPLTSNEHRSIPAATCWAASTGPITVFAAAARAFSADILSSPAWFCSPERCSEERASKEANTAPEDGLVLVNAIRTRRLPTLVGSWPKVVNEREAVV